MVYIDAEELKWFPYVKSWADKLPDKYSNLKDELFVYLIDLFEAKVENGLTYVRKYCDYAIHQVST